MIATILLLVQCLFVVVSTLFLYTSRVSPIANDDYDDDDDDDGNGDAKRDSTTIACCDCVRAKYLFDSRLQFYPS